jgi:hypothetical protein
MELMLVIIGGTLAIVNSLILVILANLRSTQKDMKLVQDDMWGRIYNHYHEVNCENEGCRTLRTGNVIIPHGSR